MSDERYNGWENYETWNVNLWLSNDEGIYFQVQAVVEAVDKDTDQPQAILADRIQEFVENCVLPDLGASMASDLLTHALGRVNWDEIARAFLEK